MENDELPSESTSRPRFRRSNDKITGATNETAIINAKPLVGKRKLKLPSTRTKRSRIQTTKKPVSGQNKQNLDSNSKKQQSKEIIHGSSETDDDEIQSNSNSMPVKTADLRTYSTHQMNIQIQNNDINLDASFASDDTDDNEKRQQLDVTSKTTVHSKQDALKYFTKQITGEFTCNLCTNTYKVIFLLSIIL